MDPRTPVLVGVGQIVVRDGNPPAPAALMEAAARAAAEDAGAPALLDRVGVLAVVDAMSQPLATPDIAHGRLWRSGLGGNGPQALVCELSDAIADGSLDVAVITGAEAMTAFSRALKAGEAPPWAMEGGASAERQLSSDAPSDGASDAENAAGLIAPIFFYPLIEHAIRADAGRTRDEHVAHISALWAGFAAVAAGNPNAWTRTAPSAEEIATVSDGNRRVSDPYLKLHNSHIGVDMGAALILCSAEAAGAAGVPRDRWVFPWAGARGHDHFHVTTRAELHRSPAIRLAGEALREHCAADYAHVDLYSCFPSAVQIAARELELSGTLTTTGGLTFGGGPGNNYSTHGIATLAGLLREDPDAVGLATALGWYATKHALGVYSSRPPERAYRTFDVQEQVDALPSVTVADGYAGAGTVESFTALYERDGSPGMGIVAARLADGRRAMAKSHDPDTLASLVDGEDPIGRPVSLTAPEGFSLS